MTDAHTHEHAPKVPAKKRATRKKVVHLTHAQLEREAFYRKMIDAINARKINSQQVKALARKIIKREATISLQSGV